MAREFRRITFSNSELKDALSHCRKEFESRFRSSDVVLIASVRKNQKILLELELYDFSKEKSSRLEIDEGVVRDCLLGYCRTQNIPLPRVAEKDLRIIESKVCIDMNFDVHARHTCYATGDHEWSSEERSA